MVLAVVSRLLPLVLGLWLAAAPLLELFQKAKQEFKLGSYGSALATLEKLDAESAKPELQKDREALLPALLFYKGACLASLGRQAEARETFEAFLALKPDVKLDPAMYPKPVVAALESARKEVSRRQTQPAEAGMLATAYRAFTPPGVHLDDAAGEDWTQGPVRWLLASEERRAFLAIGDPVSRSEFIANFWKSRDSRPDTPENEFREEFDKRVAFADARFAQDEVRGSLTDRGMVFILLGPPSYSGKKMLRTGDDIADDSGLSRYSPGEIKVAQGSAGGNSAAHMAVVEKVSGPGTKVLDAANNWIEAWHYLRANLPKQIPYQELDLEFVTKQGYGKNVLQRESEVLSALERAKTLAKKS
jgi:GWxTD domain-containing protein